MHNVKPVDTPIERNYVLSKDLGPKIDEEKESMAKVPYASAIGSLMYVMMCTRPDLYFAIGMVNRYQSNFRRVHLVTVKIILRYLRDT